MPFGAEVADDGHTRFRLWAPAATMVEVELPGPLSAPACLEMEQRTGGWFELTAAAPAGSLYRFRIDGGATVPDPASRFNPDDVHGPSQVIDPADFAWTDTAWRGLPWESAALYELHVGTFTPEGTFRGVMSRLDHLATLGITAIELMPVADFPGRRGWGYDGVLPFAPDASYGNPDDLKALVQAAHQRGLMMFLDVVYNHFGPEGNYLHASAPGIFTDRHRTPWGAAINFDGDDARPVRDFFIHNALYWLREFHFDGLRLDAVHAIVDDSEPHILVELAETVRREISDRHVHLVLENDANEAHLLARDAVGGIRHFNAQWNDDFHHALHVAATGETDGYYSDSAADPAGRLARCLTSGFADQGDPSPFRDGQLRGEPSGHLPPGAFIAFAQNHDQIGNRAFGERLTLLADERKVAAAMAVLLLSPSPPMLFMGEEFAADTPFLFFCDFGPDLSAAVTAGRRREFAAFAKFSNPEAMASIPDPGLPETFARSRLDWGSLTKARHGNALARTRELLAVRQREIVPLLKHIHGGSSASTRQGDRAFHAWWRAQDATLSLLANFGDTSVSVERPEGRIIHRTSSDAAVDDDHILAPWSVVWSLLETAGSAHE